MNEPGQILILDRILHPTRTYSVAQLAQMEDAAEERQRKLICKQEKCNNEIFKNTKQRHPRY
jgi:hypothetical protein